MNLKIKKIIYSYFLVLILGVFLVIQILWTYDPRAKIYFFDVGQGDATLIKTSDYRYVLIDGGRDNVVLYKLGQYLPFYVKTIDLVVLTHPDSDHLIGLNETLERYKVRNVLLTGVADDNEAYQQFLKLISDKQVNVWLAGVVDSVSVAPEVNLTVLYPPQSIAGQDFIQDNDWSIVNRLDFGSKCLLLMGDATKKIEQYLVNSQKKIKCDILKVGHHGSNTSSTKNFLKAVDPDLGIISVGQNRYGHPSLDVMARLAEQEIGVLTTQSDGDIIVTLEKSGFVVD